MHYTTPKQYLSGHPMKRSETLTSRAVGAGTARIPVPLARFRAPLCATADPSIRWDSPSGRRLRVRAVAAGEQSVLHKIALVSQARCCRWTGFRSDLPAAVPCL
ncbi:MAG TPA: hypothetical protein VIL07_05410 [Symbiobacteriaceae bacterium]